MQENTHGATPNDKEPKPETPAQGDDKNGSEPGEPTPAAANNNNPAKGKKPRRTDAEILRSLQKKLGEVAIKEREVKGRLEKARNKELVKLKLVIGDSSLNYLKTVGNPEHAKRLIDLLRRSAIVRDKNWVKENFDRLIKEHTDPKPNQDDANGESPSPS
jgi:hypothetical protein